MSVAESHESVGATIADRYRVEALLGRGGMASVYRVRDTKTQRVLALKRSYAPTATLSLKRRAVLEREYHTLAQLAHPLIIEVYDFGIDALGPFYTMELLDGADLQHSGRLPWRQACAVLRDVGSALAMLHARGFVHRDVSTRNVRRTADGSAKLLDFGSMASMGVSASVIGTPPFLAPEALQMQALDGRTDLFALGALGYFLLTGRQAFPAARFSDLREVWRSQPIPVSRIDPEVPAALSALIARLLTLDRGARPHGAAEVIASVCAIANLPAEDEPAVRMAYLTTPRLVGRDNALIAIRKCMLSLVRNDGASVLIEGESGSGRSRLLDACALEAKLAGAHVVRAAASGADATRDFALAHTLITGLLELLPEQVSAAARLSRGAVVRPFLSGVAGDDSTTTVLDRGATMRELRDLVLTVARKHRLLVIVDDVDRVDAPSAALLAALAHKTERHALMIVSAAEAGRAQMASGALRLMRATAEVIALDNLTAEHSESLLRSVFGDVANLQLIAGRVYAVARGNPRATMEMAQHLVDRGFARYTAGGWSLPGHLDERDLPSTLADSLAARLNQLSPDALELASMLALAQEDGIQASEYATLTDHADAQRVFGALDELLTARVLVALDAVYQFTQRGYVSALSQKTPADQLERIHLRLAERLSGQSEHTLRRAHHLLAAGHEVKGVELLCSVDLRANVPALALLDRALQCAERHRLPLRFIQQLRIAVLTEAPYVFAFDTFRRVWPDAMTCLKHESGLALIEQLHELPPAERLSKALELAQAQHAATPEHERAHDLFGALQQLAVLCGTGISFGLIAIDLEFLERLPDLSALRPLSPAFDIVVNMVESAKLWTIGRFDQARAIQMQVMERLSQPDRAGFDEVTCTRTQWGVRYMTAQIDASAGVDIEERATLLEREPSMCASAWQLRQAFYLSQGNLTEARKCLRRSELLRLQNAHEQYLVGQTSTVELVAASATHDMQGVRDALDVIALRAEQAAGWKPFLLYGQSRYRVLQGDLQGARELLLAGLALAQPGKHMAWSMLASNLVNVLTQLGANDEAVGLGRRYVELSDALELHSAPEALHAALARALSAAGRHVEAMQLADQHIARSEAHGYSGVALGSLLELRARIALALEDRSGFQHFAERCAQEYKKGKNAALQERFARLLADAGEQQTHTLLRAAVESLTLPAEGPYETVHSRMRECSGRLERARCALTLLLQDLESFAGHLYQVLPGDSGGYRLEPLTAVPEDPPDSALTTWATSWLHAKLAFDVSDEVVTRETGGDARSEGPAPVQASFRDEQGRTYAAVPLATHGTVQHMVAVLVFETAPRGRRTPNPHLVAELVDELLEPNVSVADDGG